MTSHSLTLDRVSYRLADGRPLLHQVRDWCQAHGPAPTAGWDERVEEPVPVRLPGAMQGGAGGGFFDDGRAWRIALGQGRHTTRPWINVLANPGFGALLSESGGGNTWAGNSRLNQLTTWGNDPVADTPAEWFLLQDRRTHAVWSLTPSAWGDAEATHSVVHAQGRTTISHRRGDLDIAVHWSVDAETAVKQVRIEIVNRGHHMAHLRTVAMVEWLMGEKRSDRATLHTGRCLADEPVGLVGLIRRPLGAVPSKSFVPVPNPAVKAKSRLSGPKLPAMGTNSDKLTPLIQPKSKARVSRPKFQLKMAMAMLTIQTFTS